MMRFLLCLLTFTLGCGDDRPAVVQEFGGREVPFDATVRTEWVDLMTCVGLDTTPPRDLRLFLLAPDAPPISMNADLPQLAWYVDDARHIIVRGDVENARLAWRHEFLHARQRDRNNHHGPVFAMAPFCEFAP